MSKVFWIASREFVATVFTKAFLIGLLFLPIVIGVILLVMRLMDNDDYRASGRIAILDPSGRVTAEAREMLRSHPLEAQFAEGLRASGRRLSGAADFVETLDVGPDFTLMQLPADADLEAEKAFLLEPPDAGGLLALVEIHADAIEAASPEAELGSYDLYAAASIDERETAAVRAMLRDAIVNLRIEAYGFDRATINRLTRLSGGQSITVTETEERLP